MTSLVYVTITGQFLGGDETPLNGTATFTASQAVYSAGQEIVTPDVPVAAQITDGVLLAESGGALQLLATDNAGLTFLTLSGFFYWSVQVTAGGVTESAWSFGLPSSPSTRDLFSLANMPFGGGSSGTVTSVSVATANGLAGTVANPASTPAITLRTTVTGLLKGNGTAISAATAGTDYAPATSGSAILKGNGSGGFSAASAGTDYLAPAGNGSQLTGITASQVGADSSGAAAAVAAAVAAEIGQPSGIASLDGSGHVPAAQLALALIAASNLSDLGSRQAALNNLAGAVTSGRFLRGDGTNVSMSAIQASDVPTLNQSTSGNAATATNLAGAAAFPAEVSPKVITLTQSAGSVAVNGALGNVFRLVLTASGWTLANPTGMTDGQAVRVRLIQDGTGSRTISYGSAWDFGTAGAPTLSTGANKVDYIVGEWSADANAGAGAVAVSPALGY